VVWPDKFKPDIGARYDGTTNPVEFLQLYVVAIQAACGDQRAMANWFPMALKDAPRTWLMNLPHESVTSWKDLCRQFVANFMPTYERLATKNDLKAVRQYKGKTLRQYIQHFSQMRNKIPRISNEEVISAFSTGVSDVKMREKLSVNDELTSVVRLFEIIDSCAKAERGGYSCTTCRRHFPQSRSPRTPSERRLLSSRRNQIISNAAGTAPNAIKVDVAATTFSTRRTPTIPTIVGLSRSFMRKTTSPSAAGVAAAMARVDPGAIAATTTARKVAAVRVHLEPITSRCRCPYQ
jgi:hypothetical protein